MTRTVNQILTCNVIAFHRDYDLLGSLGVRGQESITPMQKEKTRKKKTALGNLLTGGVERI